MSHQQPRVDMAHADMEGADLVAADLWQANLEGSNLERADLRAAYLREANLQGANLRGAFLRRADLRGADLRGANLQDADLEAANLQAAKLEGANLQGANIRNADLSGAVGLLDPIDYLQEHFERDPDGRGIIAYKVFGAVLAVPPSWDVRPGRVISEAVHPDRCMECASGINVATLDWIRRNPFITASRPVWRVLIRWEWLPGVVVPYNTDGKIRAGRVELLDVVDPAEQESEEEEIPGRDA